MNENMRNLGAGWELQCPGCGEWAFIDDDQLHGRVSVWHDPGCGYHETVNWWEKVAKTIVGEET